MAPGAHLNEVRKFVRQNDAEPMITEEFEARPGEAWDRGYQGIRLEVLGEGKEAEAAAIPFNPSLDPLADPPAEIAAERELRHRPLVGEGDERRELRPGNRQLFVRSKVTWKEQADVDRRSENRERRRVSAPRLAA